MTSSAEAKHLKLATLLAPVTESTMVYMGEDLHITWRLGKLTPAFQARVSREAGDPEKDAANLAELVVSWDLEGDDGKPYPTTPEALAALPSTFIAAVSTFLVTAVLPKVASEVASLASSSPEET